MSLSVCFLTRNEEANIARALRSVAGVADEVILADTASRDRTVEIAADLGAKVIQYPWDEDFAAGRDFTIAQATGDWILWLNADEELLPSCHAHLKACLPLPSVFGYFVVLQNLTQADRLDEFVQTSDLRLFRRRPDLAFIGRLHPHFHPDFVATIQKDGSQVLPSQVTIRSYAALGERTEAKLRWTLRLLELELRDRPDQLHYVIEHGRTLLLLNDPKAHAVMAEAVQQILPARTAERAPALNIQVLLEYLLATPAEQNQMSLPKSEAVELALRWFPRSPRLLFSCAQYSFQARDLRRSAEILERLLQLGKTGTYDRSHTFPRDLVGDDALVNLAVCYRELGELDKAEQCYRLLVHSTRFRSQGMEGLAAIQQLRRPGAPASIAIGGPTDPKDRRHDPDRKGHHRKK
jgi:tetratricopeptide (TPR) repeat protein